VLGERADAAVRQGVRFVILECTHLEYISSPIGHLVHWKDNLHQSFRGDLILVGINAKIRAILDMMKLTQFFQIYSTVLEALEAAKPMK
jgi:anti-anti-sigma regulatory factor